MFNRWKKSLVDSYVGAIALGWVFAQGVFHFAFMFAAPVADWLTRRQIRAFPGQPVVASGLSFQDGLPDLIESICLLVVGYILMRWLYFPTSEPEPTSQTADVL